MKMSAGTLLAKVLFAGCGGPGTETYSDGSTYAGELKSGLRHGPGTVTAANSPKYACGWKEGFTHGKGLETLADGTT